MTSRLQATRILFLIAKFKNLKIALKVRANPVGADKASHPELRARDALGADPVAEVAASQAREAAEVEEVAEVATEVAIEVVSPEQRRLAADRLETMISSLPEIPGEDLPDNMMTTSIMSIIETTEELLEAVLVDPLEEMQPEDTKMTTIDLIVSSIMIEEAALSGPLEVGPDQDLLPVADSPKIMTQLQEAVSVEALEVEVVPEVDSEEVSEAASEEATGTRKTLEALMKVMPPEVGSEEETEVDSEAETEKVSETTREDLEMVVRADTTETPVKIQNIHSNMKA